MNLLSFVLRNTGIEATRHFMNRAELHVHVQCTCIFGMNLALHVSAFQPKYGFHNYF